MILGTIHAVDDDNGLQLIIDGEDDPTTKKYTYIASYVPAADDRVIIEEISGSYVILGKIISDKDLSGIARTAESAQTAVTAQTAATATTATNATVAASCTGNAATATTAASCSGNAATATTATTASNLSNSGTTNGYLVYSVTKEYSSQLGMDIVTNVSLQGNKHNYVYKN